MRRWEILLWLAVAAGVICLLAFFLFRDSAPAPVNPPPQPVNPDARLAGSGSPLPAPAAEDVIVEQQQFDGRIFTYSYDFNSGNWQLDFHENGSQSLRYVAASEAFFYHNLAAGFWDEVDEALLHEQYKELRDTDSVLLSQAQLEQFNRLAIEQESATCEQDESALCAVWQAKNFLNQQEFVIYVNKRSRKIDHVVTFNSADAEAFSLLAFYTYQPLEIPPPPPAKTRFLSDG